MGFAQKENPLLPFGKQPWKSNNIARSQKAAQWTSHPLSRCQVWTKRLLIRYWVFWGIDFFFVFLNFSFIFIKTKDFELCHNFATIWVFECSHNLSCQANKVYDFVFCKNLVLKYIDIYFFLLFVFELSWVVFQFLSCHNLRF